MAFLLWTTMIAILLGFGIREWDYLGTLCEDTGGRGETRKPGKL